MALWYDWLFDKAISLIGLILTVWAVLEVRRASSAVREFSRFEEAAQSGVFVEQCLRYCSQIEGSQTLAQIKVLRELLNDDLQRLIGCDLFSPRQVDQLSELRAQAAQIHEKDGLKDWARNTRGLLIELQGSLTKLSRKAREHVR